MRICYMMGLSILGVPMVLKGGGLSDAKHEYLKIDYNDIPVDITCQTPIGTCISDKRWVHFE